MLRASPPAGLLRRIALVPARDQYTSSITVGELHYGARRLGARSGALIEQIERSLLAHLVIVPFDTAAARVYGEVRASLERNGTPIGDADIRIAAIALVSDLIVVTRNTRHFSRVERLHVEDWVA